MRKNCLQASEYYINEAIQSRSVEKSKYLNYAVELYNKLLNRRSGKKGISVQPFESKCL